MTSNSEPVNTAEQIELYDINKAVAKKYNQGLLDLVMAETGHDLKAYLMGRGILLDEVASWQLGYAPDEWKYVTQPLIEKGAFVPAVAAGICVEDGTKKYDFFRNRLMIPLIDERRQVIGFTGRALAEGQQPKYLNTRETGVFRKSEHLFGIDKALRSISRTKSAVLTEGNFDVISLHRYGVDNAVGKGGTALTEAQVDTLKRLAETVTLIYDVDENGAGQTALEKDCETLLNAGLRVSIFHLPQPESGGKVDADSWLLTFMAEEKPPKFSLSKHIQKETGDGLLWLARRWTDTEDLAGQIAGETKAIHLLAKVDEETWRKKYAKKLATLCECEEKGILKQAEGIRKANAQAQAETAAEDELEDDDLTAFRSVQYRQNGSMWIYTNNKNWVCVADDFQLFVKYSTEDDQEEKTWILEIKKRHVAEPLYIEVTHDEFCSAGKLKNKLAGYRLAFKITDSHLGELWQHLFRMAFPSAVKVNRLGYHADSRVFFFSNKAVNGELIDPDEFGIVSSKGPTGERIYLSMPNQGKKKPTSFFRYTDGSMTFNAWFTHMVAVHKYENVFVPACFYLMALFRDVLIKNTSTSPMLFLKGGASSGKSSLIRSMCQLFGFEEPAVNLKSRVLEAALIRKMSQQSNGLIWLEEFHNDTEHVGVFQASYDNTGYSRSSDTTGIDTNSVDIYSSVAFTSNYVPADPIVFTRCIFIPIVDQQKTDEQVTAYQTLKERGTHGLACVTVEMLQHRDLIEAQFNEAFNNLYRLLKYEVRSEKVVERFISNVAQVMTVAYILQVHEKISLMEHTDEDDILNEFVAIGVRVISRQHQIASEKSNLSEFFEIVQNQYESGYIQEDIHFRFEGNQIHLRFPSLYVVYAQRYRQAYYKSPADRDTLKSEMLAFDGGDAEKFFKNIRFAPDEADDVASRTRSVSGCCTMDYVKLQDAFGLDFTLRRNRT